MNLSDCGATSVTHYSTAIGRQRLLFTPFDYNHNTLRRDRVIVMGRSEEPKTLAHRAELFFQS